MKLSVFYSIAPNSKLPDEYVWMSLFFSATYNAVCFRPNEIYTITSKERKKPMHMIYHAMYTIHSIKP